MATRTRDGRSPARSSAPRVDQHGLLADALEAVLDLERLDGPVLRQDLREQLAQARDVPLAVAELVDQAPLGLRAIDLKRVVEGAVGGQHPQILAQDEERLADRVDDALAQDPSFVSVRQGGGFCHRSFPRQLACLLAAQTPRAGAHAERNGFAAPGLPDRMSRRPHARQHDRDVVVAAGRHRGLEQGASRSRHRRRRYGPRSPRGPRGSVRPSLQIR